MVFEVVMSKVRLKRIFRVFGCVAALTISSQSFSEKACSSGGALFVEQTFSTTHNSYSGNLKSGKPRGSILQQLDNGVRGIELDIHAGGKVLIGHDVGGHEVFHKHGNPSSSKLDEWFEMISTWSQKNRNHAPVVLTLDLKKAWDEDDLKELEILFVKRFQKNHYTKKEWDRCQYNTSLANTLGKVMAVINPKKYSGDVFFVYEKTGDNKKLERTPFINHNAKVSAVDRERIESDLRDRRLVRVYNFDSHGGKFGDLPVAFRATDTPFSSQYLAQNQRIGVIPSATIPRTQWVSGGSAHYDTGREASIAINDHNFVIEVHKSQSNSTLWYHVGTVDPSEMSIDFGASRQYDEGVRPSISLNNQNQVVEMHKSRNNDGMWYRTGIANMSAKTVSWGPSRSMGENGFYPSIALNDAGTVIEVHQSENSDTVWYRLGKFNASGKRIDWWSGANLLSSSARRPKVSLNEHNEFIVVWESGDHVFSRIGKIQDHVVTWKNIYGSRVNSFASVYDTGASPSVTLLNNGQALEVHKSVSHNKLWFRDGIRRPSAQMWQFSEQYTTGKDPQVSMNENGVVVAVHTAPDNDRLFYRVGKNSLQPINLNYFTNGLLKSRSNHLCLNVKSGSVKINSCTDGLNEQWQFFSNGKIYNRETESCLNLNGTSNDVAEAECSGTVEQKWLMTRNGQIKSMSNGLCLDARTQGGSYVVATCNGAADQIWDHLVKVNLVNEENEKCLNLIDGTSNTNIYTCLGSEDQKWHLYSSGEVRNQFNDQCLNVVDSESRLSASHGVNAYQCVGSEDQKWSLQPNGYLINTFTHSCLNVIDGTRDVNVYRCNPEQDHVWGNINLLDIE